MPRKKKGVPAQQGPGTGEWVQSAAAAFDEAYHSLPAGRLPSAEESARAVAKIASPVVGAGSSSSAGAAEVPLSQARLGGIMLHRQSGEGLTATGFEPERHSVMVLGRPVQASPPSVASGGSDGCFLLCVPCHPHHPRKPLRVAQSLSPCHAVCCFSLRSTTLLQLRPAEPFAACPSVVSCDCKLRVLAFWCAGVRPSCFHTRARPGTSSSRTCSMF